MAKPVDAEHASCRDRSTPADAVGRRGSPKRSAPRSRRWRPRCSPKGTGGGERRSCGGGGEKLSDAEAARLAKAAAARRCARGCGVGRGTDGDDVVPRGPTQEGEGHADVVRGGGRRGARGTEGRGADRRAAPSGRVRAGDALLSEQKHCGEGQRQVALLNQQAAELRAQLARLGALDASEAKILEPRCDREARRQPERGARQSSRFGCAREKERLQAEVKDLASYRSEFFGRMRAILGEARGHESGGRPLRLPLGGAFHARIGDAERRGTGTNRPGGNVIREVARPEPTGDPVEPAGGRAHRQHAGEPDEPVPGQLGAVRGAGRSVVRYIIEGAGASRPTGWRRRGSSECPPIEAGSSPEALARNRRMEGEMTER